MRVLIGALLVSVSTLSAYGGDVSTKEAARIQEAATVLKEIHAVPDKDIPQELWQKAACVVVIPGMKKAAFIFGGEYGKGLMSCRHDSGWSGPVFATLSVGGIPVPIVPEEVWFVLRVYLLSAFFVWLSWSVPRVRIDQILNIGWKRLIPYSLLAILVAAAFRVIG